MEVIHFNGYGQPRNPEHGTGTIALLIQYRQVDVVRVELLGPNENGPALEHALNGAELKPRVNDYISKIFPQGLKKNITCVLVCPPEIAE
ncbi:MAG: hypothetical protein CVV27_05780, partial [Candidatus Melainabacteria bacterium HGW-Melainabacteria-1]